MYSPQRNKVPLDRFSPSKSPNDDRLQKRPYEGLTLEQFLASKKSKTSSPVRSSPKRPTSVYNRMTTTSPIRSQQTYRTTTAVSNRSRISTVQSRISPVQNRIRPVQNRISTVQHRTSPIQNRITQTRISTVQNRISPVQNRIRPVQNHISPIQSRIRPVQNQTSPVQNRTTHYTTTKTNTTTIIPNTRTKTTIIPNHRNKTTIIPNRRASVYMKPTNVARTEPKIQVCIRKRPLNKVELASKEQDIAPLSGTRTIDILAPKQKVDLTRYTEQHAFTFDEVFDSDASNTLIYQQTTRPLVEHMFGGGKATCFAYGQTGSGKTYTMLDSKHGLYVQATFDIFRLLNQPHYAHLQAWVGYYEIYQGQLFDLLNNRRQLIPREDGKGNVHISGLKEHRIHSSDTMRQVFNYGNRERSTSKTNANEASSRSHAILQILLKNDNGIHGKLNFIDLAGSERGIDRGHSSDAKIRLEGAEINRSLLALKECIRALDQDKKHAPFRGSKLTMVLKDSFIGNSKTCMIATISPNHSNSDHTLNTLRYADRVKELRGESDPRLVEKKDDLIQQDDVPRKITQGHIKEFMHWHQVQVECNQQYLKESQTLLQNLSQHPSQDYLKTYKNSLEDLMNRKERSIQKLKDRIGLELDD